MGWAWGEGLPNITPTSCSWDLHPVWLCLCGTAVMGKTNASPKTLQNCKAAECYATSKQLYSMQPHGCQWWATCHMCSSGGMVPPHRLGESWVSVTLCRASCFWPCPQVASFTSTTSQLLFLIQPPVSPYCAKMWWQKVCLRHTPWSCCSSFEDRICGFPKASKEIKSFGKGQDPSTSCLLAPRLSLKQTPH